MGVLVSQTRALQFREMLGQRVLVADGGMGTMLYAVRPFMNRCWDEMNLSLPALVRDVHREFVRAGSEILETNTFGANRKRLGDFGFADKVRQINQAGVRIAREAARDQAFVAGAVGPLGVRVDPLGTTTCAEARECFREQVAALIEAGVDLLVLETFRDLSELREAIFGAREAAGPEMVLAAHVSVNDDGTLADGSTIESFTRSLDEWPVDIVGLNCSPGPRVVLDTIEKMAAYTGKPLSAMPSAGLPDAVCSPAYMAQYARRFVRAGCTLVGGCCGTTPEHIRAIRDEIQDLEPELSFRRREMEAPVPSGGSEEVVVSLAQKSHLGAKLADGRFVTLLAMRSPRGVDASGRIKDAKGYKAAGVDAVTVADGPGARLSAQATCQLIQQKAGIETVLRFSGRGRSIASIQSDLMSAHALGVRNILCAGDDAATVASILNTLNHGLNLGGLSSGGLSSGGNRTGSRTALALGVEMNPASPEQLERIARAGVEFIVAGPVFDVGVFETFVKQAEPYKLPVVAGIWLLTSVRDGEYAINELHVPVLPPYMARMSVAGDGAREGSAIAGEIMEQARNIAAGVQLSTPFGGCEMALKLVQEMIPQAMGREING